LSWLASFSRVTRSTWPRAGGPDATTLRSVDLEEAIRTRRTHKAFDPKPVPRDTLEELFDLARWAPNHHLTNPWRFRVIGPASLDRLKRAAGAEAAAKLDRCPTLVICSAALSGDPVADEEDLHATAIASYIVLLAAHAHGLAGYWRTPEVLRTAEGRAAVELPDDERFVSLLHIGYPVQEQRVPERAPAAEAITYLD
jgi:nitroreductase